jgi:hypothetical protein
VKLKWLGSTFLVSALTLSCGGGGGGGDTPSEAILASIDQTCSIAHECRDSFPPDLGFEFVDLFENTEAECVTAFNTGLDLDAVEASVDAGRVIFDAGDARTCQNAIEALNCAQFWGDEESADIPECDTDFVGTVADGGTCTISLDCTNDDSFCDEETLVCAP